MEIKKLKESNDFLNKLLENIASAVFLTDNSIKIKQINNSCKNLFHKNESQMLNHLCGNAMGCINVKKYKKDCGETPACNSCKLRQGIIKVLNKNQGIENQILERNFIILDEKINKYLEYSIEPLEYRGENMAIVIIHDITQLESQKRAIIKINNEINNELDIAKRVQEKILPPKKYENNNLLMEVFYRPFMKISGDFYYVTKLEDDKEFIFLADITGHGIPASLYITMLKENLDTILPKYTSASKIIEKLNILLNKFLPEGYYFPAIALILDFKNKKLSYSNAGSDNPIFIQNKIVIQLKEKGPLLGLIPDIEFKEEEMSFKKEDEIFMYTDGVLTLKSDSDINEISKDYALQFFLDCQEANLMNKIKKYTKYMLNYKKGFEWGDDVTVIGIKIK